MGPLKTPTRPAAAAPQHLGRVMLDCHRPSARPVSTCGSRSPEITCLSGRRGDATRSASESWQRSAAGPGTLCGRSDANAAQSAKVRRHYLGGDDRTTAGRHARGLCSRVALPDAPVTLGQRHSRLGAHRLGSCDITLTSAGLSTWPGRLAAPLPVTGRDSARCLQCPLLGEADGYDDRSEFAICSSWARVRSPETVTTSFPVRAHTCGTAKEPVTR
jgi:hypothetical protein